MSGTDRRASPEAVGGSPVEWITHGSIPAALVRLALPMTATMFCQ
ncbi:MAG: hypothetical protein ACYTGB_06265 [Planctomycetota bacterium]|jgi:hypothetical protein